MQQLPKELLDEAKYFFRNLCDSLDELVAPTLQAVADIEPQSRIENDWNSLKKKLGSSLTDLLAKFHANVKHVGDSCHIDAIPGKSLLPQDCDSAFATLAADLHRRVNSSLQALSILRWSLQYFDDRQKILTQLLSGDLDTAPNSLRSILLRGKTAADDIQALERIKTKLAAIETRRGDVSALATKIKGIQRYKAPLDNIKLLSTYSEQEVSTIFGELSRQTLENWKLLYPQSPTNLIPGSVVKNQKQIESLLSGKDYSVQARFFANSGLQRAIALAFYFALLHKHPKGLGFVLMDDSILSLDDQHRETWSADLLKPLMRSMQVIFATHQGEYVRNCQQDFDGGRMVQLNSRARGQPISWRPGNRLQSAELELTRFRGHFPM